MAGDLEGRFDADPRLFLFEEQEVSVAGRLRIGERGEVVVQMVSDQPLPVDVSARVLLTSGRVSDGEADFCLTVDLRALERIFECCQRDGILHELPEEGEGEHVLVGERERETDRAAEVIARLDAAHVFAARALHGGDDER